MLYKDFLFSCLYYFIILLRNLGVNVWKWDFIFLFIFGKYRDFRVMCMRVILMLVNYDFSILKFSLSFFYYVFLWLFSYFDDFLI